MRIAIDAMGGDYAPAEMARGVALALESGEFRAEELLLVGDESQLIPLLQESGIDPVPEILHTDEVVEGHESPVTALKQKRRASITLAMMAMKKGEVEGVVSFGNTGAAVAAAQFVLGMLPGIRRPAICVAPARMAMLDLGANPQPKPLHMMHNALMGAAFAHVTFGVEHPRIGLLNIGGERGKGTTLTKMIHDLLEDSELNFVGNVEPQDLFSGSADVVVSDGFVGNVVIKTVEGVTTYLGEQLRRELPKTEEVEDSVRAATRRIDYQEVGGACLLGADGDILIGHGRSRAPVVPAALRTVRRDIENRLNEQITKSLDIYASKLKIVAETTS